MKGFPGFDPFDYQRDIHQKLLSNYNQDVFRNLVRAFTGAGKTTGIAAFLPLIFPELMQEGPMLFISHRREILFQSYAKFVKLFPNKSIGLEMGKIKANGLEDIIFISVESLGRLGSNRMKKYVRAPKIICLDEGHHVKKAGTWDRILNAFGVGSNEQGFSGKGLHPLVVFLTATPNRGDGATLGHWVDNYRKEHEIDYGLDFGIDNGWLVKPNLYDLHLQNKHISQMDNEERAAVVCKVKEKFAVDLQTLIFAGNVDQGKIIRSTLSDLGIGRGVGEVYSDTDKILRDEWLENFRPDREIETMVNRLVLTEGYDNPWVQCIIDDGNTEIDALFEQKVGRGLRPWVDPVTGRRCLEGCTTVAERLTAIANSPKPYLPYFATYDTSQLELSAAISLHVVEENGEIAMPTCNPIVDVIIYVEEENEEIPPMDWSDLDNIELYAIRRDVFTGSVFNDKLHVLSPLRWCVDQDKGEAYLWIEKSDKVAGVDNPLANTDTPTIWMIRRKAEREWQFVSVDVGGWSESAGRATKASYQEWGTTESFSGMMNKMDQMLREWDPKAYQYARREAFSTDPATARDIKFMKSKGIKFGPAVTRRTAAILKDDSRIRTSLSKLGLI